MSIFLYRGRQSLIQKICLPLHYSLDFVTMAYGFVVRSEKIKIENDNFKAAVVVVVVVVVVVAL